MAVVNLAMNASKPYNFIDIAEYFINEEKYFYLILLHTYTVICVGMLIMLGIGTLFITLLEHICGMFRIARYEYGHNIIIELLYKINYLFIQHIILKKVYVKVKNSAKMCF